LREVLFQQIDCVIPGIGALDKWARVSAGNKIKKWYIVRRARGQRERASGRETGWVSESADKPIEWNTGNAAGVKPSFDLR
jgi:hypothetical protein